MQAAEREAADVRVMGAELRVELPEPLWEPARALLGPLAAPPRHAHELGSDAAIVRISPRPEGWQVETDSHQLYAATDDDALLCLQSLMLEIAAARRGDRLLFRGSVVTRGAQSLLLVGDLGSAHAVLALALTSLEFRLVSVGTAAFDGRRRVPLPLPLLFYLEPTQWHALQALPRAPGETVERVSSELFRPAGVTAAPEPTHVIFPEAHGGHLSLVRPISATAARSRLCSALITAPVDQSPFAAVANVLRHTRGVHLSIGDLAQALEQLGRLLPRWSVADGVALQHPSPHQNGASPDG